MSSISRSLTGPMLTFDLGSQVEELRSEDSYRRSGRAGRTLAKSGGLRVVLTAMAEGNVIGVHQAHSPMTIHLLSGHLTYRMDGAEEELAAGNLLLFGPGDAHDITATEDSAVLLTLSADPDSPDRD